MNHKALVILVLAVAVGIYFFVVPNKQPNTIHDVESVVDIRSQIAIDFLEFVENEQLLFEREFDISQRSIIQLMGEKEREELISDSAEVRNTGGICFVSGFQDGARDFEDIGFILINPDNWETLSYVNKKSLISHELAHCSLAFPGHVESNAGSVTVKNKRSTYLINNREADCPISILTTSLFSDEQEVCLRDNMEYYIEDIHIRTGR